MTASLNQPVRGLDEYLVSYSVPSGGGRSRARLTAVARVYARDAADATRRFVKLNRAIDARVYRVARKES